MTNKQKIAIILITLQGKVGQVFATQEHDLTNELSETLNEISMSIDEVMSLVADIKERVE